MRTHPRITTLRPAQRLHHQNASARHGIQPCNSAGYGGYPPRPPAQIQSRTRGRALFTGKQFSQRGADVPLTEQHIRPVRFRRGKPTDAALNQALSWAGTRLPTRLMPSSDTPGKFHWLTFSCCQKRWQCSGLQ